MRVLLKRALNWVNLHPGQSFDWAFYSSVLIFSFAVWFPTRYLPFHWDSAAFIVDAANHFLNNGFLPFIAVGSNFSHPPLLPAIVALLLKNSSHPVFWSHVLMFPFLPLLIYSVFRLGTNLHSRLLGLMSAVAVALTPVVLAESVIVYLDLPSASLALFGLSLLTSKKYALAAVAVALGSLFKLTALIVVPFFIVYFWQHKKLTKQALTLSLTPCMLYVLWLLYHFSVTGWFLAEPAAQLETRISLNLDTLLLSTRVYLTQLFLDQNRLVLTLLGFLAVGFIYSKIKLKAFLKQHQLFFLGLGFIFLVSSALFIISAQILPRYLVILFPFVYLFFFYLILEAIRNLSPKLQFGLPALIMVLISSAFISVWHPRLSLDSMYRFTPPADLRVIDMIRTFQNVSAFIDINHPNIQVFGAFPENFYLQRPNLGYVSSPSNFKFCQDFASVASASNLLVIHPYSPNQQNCRSLLDTYQATLLTRAQENGTWAEIYAITATQSAQNFREQVD